jgi:hypothetical protein
MKSGTLWIVIAALCALGNWACGGGGSGNGIVVTIGAPTSMAVGTSATVTDMVTGGLDSGNSGVGLVWTCTPAASWGTASFNPNTLTVNTIGSIFTAPATVPAGGTLTIIATVQTVGFPSASANIAITDP